MPTKIKGKLTEFKVTFAYCEGVLCVTTSRPVKYNLSSEDYVYYVNIRFMSDKNDVIDKIRKTDNNEITLNGSFVNDDDELIFAVTSVED